jgi:cytoskeletal protein CcmA (bactofilin family)
MAETDREIAHIGKSVVIKGELSGSEDLYLDGEVEGTIELKQNSITVGTNGRVKAKITAKTVIVDGKVEGDIFGSERVEIRSSANVNGNIATKRIVIAEGASFRGSVTQEGQSSGS